MVKDASGGNLEISLYSGDDLNSNSMDLQSNVVSANHKYLVFSEVTLKVVLCGWRLNEVSVCFVNDWFLCFGYLIDSGISFVT